MRNSTYENDSIFSACKNDAVFHEKEKRKMRRMTRFSHCTLNSAFISFVRALGVLPRRAFFSVQDLFLFRRVLLFSVACRALFYFNMDSLSPSAPLPTTNSAFISFVRAVWAFSLVDGSFFSVRLPVWRLLLLFAAHRALFFPCREKTPRRQR